MNDYLEQYKTDFSKYKELNVFGVKPGMYLISPIGDVYSCKTRKWMSTFVKDKTNRYAGIRYVKLIGDDDKQHKYIVARLVMATFNGMPPADMKDPTVDHIDGDSLNNYFRNLRWMEREENTSMRHIRLNGEENGRAKLTQEDVISICNQLLKGSKISELANQYSVSPRAIRSIVDKENWKHITNFFDFKGVM